MNHDHLLLPSVSFLHHNIPFFSVEEQKAFPLSTSVERGKQTDRFNGGWKTEVSFFFFVYEGVQS